MTTVSSLAKTEQHQWHHDSRISIIEREKGMGLDQNFMCSFVIVIDWVVVGVGVVVITLLMLGTTALNANSLSLSFFLRFLSDTMFLEAAVDAAPSGELES